MDSVFINNSVFRDNLGVSGSGICYVSMSKDLNIKLSNCSFFNNASIGVGRSGAGLYMEGDLLSINAKAVVNGCKFSNNEATYSGGSIYCVGLKVDFNLTNCLVQDNSAKNGSGVYARAFDTLVSSIHSTSIINNIGTINRAYGVGAYLQGFTALVNVNKSTIINNRADSAFGGGLFVGTQLNDGRLNINNSTISQNEGYKGEGVYFLVPFGKSATLNVSSSVIALNGTENIRRNDSLNWTSLGHNIYSNGTFSGVHSTDQLNVDSTSLNLGSLAYNGGFAPTMMPVAPSVAIDMGNPLDSSDAQNVPVVGVRDVGAAELCNVTYSIDSVIACDSYTWRNGVTYTANDTSAIFTMVNNAGCDSIIILHLTVNYSTYYTDTISSCNSYTWIDGVTYYSNTTTATYTLVNALGCDSIVTLNLTLTNSKVDTVVSCDSYTWRNGVTYTQSVFGILDTVVQPGVCDSLYVLDLTINQTEYSTDVYSVCDSLTWINGMTYYSSTSSVYDTLINRNGCDSIVNLDLTVTQSVHDTDQVTGCLFYTWSNGQIYFSDNNTATQVFNAANGCDSIWHLDLEIKYGTIGTDTQVVCDSLVWIDGNTYYANNTTALHTLVGANANGCDSIVTLNLTVNSTQTTDVITSCGSYTWIDGNTYTSSNTTATYTTQNALGCDSTVTLDLTLGTTTYGTEVVAACNSYTWNGVTYTSNTNTATDTLQNALGCDSIVTLNLTIQQPTSTVDVISSCDPITWIDGNTYIVSNNTAVYTLQNTAGCDSVITLDFTLLQPTAGTDVISSCTEITWVDGNVYTSTISGPVFTIPNAAGCDSLVTLDFTLLEVDTAVVRNYLTLTAQATNATYQWIDCDNGIMPNETNADFTATQNGDYQVEVTHNGCVDTSACFSIINVGIQQAQLLGVNVYPNPTSDVLHIDKGSNVSLEITVTNSAGSIVYNSSTKDQITTIQMAKMASGVYVVTLRNELGVSVERIVKK